MAAIDPLELRRAFGTFMTGVTVITTRGADGSPRGFTANSFTSVSLNPPLLLVCIGKGAASLDTFLRADGFAVSILAETQKEASGVFASKRPDKFAAVAWRPGPAGHPIVEGAVSWFDCTRHAVIDAGDHVVLIGCVEGFAYSDANPLGYARGGYVTLGLEQAAVNALSQGARTIVGAILEVDGGPLLMEDARTGGLNLPEVGREGPSGSASLLRSALAKVGIEANLGFLFAVFENPESHVQSIYYRGDAVLTRRVGVVVADFDALPYGRLPDDAVRSMLQRYAEERRQGRFKVYSGDHRQGEVKPLG
jgi:flavin reductase (DIM6/NTAB) family NADH-FMN oxidoreductase RutF